MLFPPAPGAARREKPVAFEETLRFPTRLEPAEIHARLARIREAATTAGFSKRVGAPARKASTFSIDSR